MEKINDDSVLNHLLTKIGISTQRNNLSAYRQILWEELENKTCFYCGKPLKEGAIHVYHFIPWSFIKDDKLWNFVLSCPKCNESKKDKLPDEAYLKRIMKRNSDSRMLAYTNANGNYREEKIQNIYSWAIANGYNTVWSPSVKGKNAE